MRGATGPQVLNILDPEGPYKHGVAPQYPYGIEPYMSPASPFANVGPYVDEAGFGGYARGVTTAPARAPATYNWNYRPRPPGPIAPGPVASPPLPAAAPASSPAGQLQALPTFDPSSREAVINAMRYDYNNPGVIQPAPYFSLQSAYGRGGVRGALGYLMDQGNLAISDKIGPALIGEQYEPPPRHFGSTGDWALGLQNVLGTGRQGAFGDTERVSGLIDAATSAIAGPPGTEVGVDAARQPSGRRGVEAGRPVAGLGDYTGELASDETRQQTTGTGAGGGAGGGGAPALQYPPGILPGEERWYDEFTKAHGGETMEDYYMRVDSRVGDPAQARTQAKMDRRWSVDFARNAGRPPNRREWTDQYYKSGGR